MKENCVQSLNNHKQALGNPDILIQIERISKIFSDTIYKIELVVKTKCIPQMYI